MSEYICEFPSNEINDLVMHERIVRCKDCEEFEPYHTYAGDVLDCGMCLKHDHETFNSRFCAWGERKERIES